MHERFTEPAAGPTRRSAWLLAAATLLLALPAARADEAATAAAQAAAPGPRIEPEARDHMLRACEYLRGRNAFSVHAESTFDGAYQNGQRVQHSRDTTALVRRPDRLHAAIDGDRGHREFIYDGRTLTIADPDAGVYGSFAAPATIEETLDEAMTRFNLNMPLADLVSADPCAALQTGVSGGWYLGRSYLAGERHHHLLFSAVAVDLQVWVSDGDAPLLRKLVLTYKDEPGTPQYTVLLSDWNFAPAVDEGKFAFEPPPGARRIGFVEYAGSAKADAATKASATKE